MPNHDSYLNDEAMHIDNNDDIGEFEDAEENEQFDLRFSVVRIIGRLQAKPSMTGSTLTNVMDECEELLSSTVNHLQRKVGKFFKEREMLQEPGVVELLQEFELDSPFEGLRSLSQQIGALKSYCNYIDAKEIPLDKRIDSGLDRETGTFVPKL